MNFPSSAQLITRQQQLQQLDKLFIWTKTNDQLDNLEDKINALDRCIYFKESARTHIAARRLQLLAKDNLQVMQLEKDNLAQEIAIQQLTQQNQQSNRNLLNQKNCLRCGFFRSGNGLNLFYAVTTLLILCLPLWKKDNLFEWNVLTLVFIIMIAAAITLFIFTIGRIWSWHKHVILSHPNNNEGTDSKKNEQEIGSMVQEFDTQIEMKLQQG